LSSYQGDIAEKIIELSRSILSPLGIKEPENLSELLKTVNLQSIFTKVISAFTSIFSRMGLIIFFLIFILLENRFLNKKLYLMIRNNPKGAEMLEILEKIESDVKTYFFVKTIVSLVTGILCYIVMLAF
jgi:predicted PurR-regulated permease PerM